MFRKVMRGWRGTQAPAKSIGAKERSCFFICINGRKIIENACGNMLNFKDLRRLCK